MEVGRWVCLTFSTDALLVGHDRACGLDTGVPTSQAQPPPQYSVDPFWPKPLPHEWILSGLKTLLETSSPLPFQSGPR
jgi:hypothetical protein